jgi:hypothetical protein
MSIYGSADARLIARELDAFCKRELGAGVAAALFYQSSIGAVAGLSLSDRRRVVIKAHPPDWLHARLSKIVRLQTYLAERCTLAPAVLGGPSALGLGLAVAEPYVQRGALRDAHDREVRRGLARSLHTLVELLAPHVTASGLPRCY